MKYHENPPRTMKNHKELDLRPLGKVIIFRDRQTDRQTEPSYYIEISQIANHYQPPMSYLIFNDTSILRILIDIDISKHGQNDIQ